MAINIDSSIPLKALLMGSPKMMGPLDIQKEAMGMQAARMKMAGAEQAQKDAMTLRGIAQGAYGPEGFDSTKYTDALNQAGFVEQASAYEKDRADTAKKNSEASGKDWDVAKEKIGYIRNAAQGALAVYSDLVSKGMPDAQARAQVQPLYQQSIQDLGATGLFDKSWLSRVPPNFDPKVVQATLAQSMKYDEMLDNQRDQQRIDEQVSARKAGNWLTQRGQDMTDARAQQNIGIARQNAETARINANRPTAGGQFGGRPPAGFRWTENGDLEEIPGGPAEQRRLDAESKRADALAKRNAAAAKVESARRQSMANADIVIGKVDEAIDQVGFFSTGAIGQVTQHLGDTPARDLNATVNTIKARLGFDQLAEMRAASPTGGALGQVTERELDLLQSAIASLDIAQSKEQLLSNLKKVRLHYSNWKQAMKQAMQEEQAGGAPAPAAGGMQFLGFE